MQQMDECRGESLSDRESSRLLVWLLFSNENMQQHWPEWWEKLCFAPDVVRLIGASNNRPFVGRHQLCSGKREE